MMKFTKMNRMELASYKGHINGCYSKVIGKGQHSRTLYTIMNVFVSVKKSLMYNTRLLSGLTTMHGKWKINTREVEIPGMKKQIAFIPCVVRYFNAACVCI